MRDSLKNQSHPKNFRYGPDKIYFDIFILKGAIVIKAKKKSYQFERYSSLTSKSRVIFAFFICFRIYF